MKTEYRTQSISLGITDIVGTLLQIHSDRSLSIQTNFNSDNIELQQVDEIALMPSQKQTAVPRLLYRDSNKKPNYNIHQQDAINITFLYLHFLKENNSCARKILMLNVIMDILLRTSILILFCLSDSQDTGISTYFIIFIQIPRFLHICTTIKLLFMDQYNLQNRSFLPISHLYRKNFILEKEPNESDMKPLNWKNNILSWRSIAFVLTPVEFCFLSIPIKNYGNIANTIMISSYILKSIEVIMFEPVLLIIMSVKVSTKNFDHGSIIYILIIVDILKYAFLNIYLAIFSETGQKNTIKI